MAIFGTKDRSNEVKGTTTGDVKDPVVSSLARVCSLVRLAR